MALGPLLGYAPAVPSKSPAQARLMAAVAHGWRMPGGGGPPVAVAKEFNAADKGKRLGLIRQRAQARALRRGDGADGGEKTNPGADE